MCTGLKYDVVCQILCWLQKKALCKRGLLSDIGFVFCLTLCSCLKCKIPVAQYLTNDTHLRGWLNKINECCMIGWISCSEIFSLKSGGDSHSNVLGGKHKRRMLKLTMNVANHLQRVLMPNAKFGSSESMYINGSSYVYHDGVVTVYPGGKISLDTYYNAFSTTLWKDECGISNVSFIASGSGMVHFRVVLLTENLVRYEISSISTELNEEKKEILKVNLDDIDGIGILYIEMISLGDKFEFSFGEWLTKQEALRSVKLGMVVTHFDRKKYVVPSMARIKNDILENEKYSGVIDLVVVDNSKNITKDEANGVKVIPNKNTGGAGGFMRGLLHYKDETEFTHVIFMDDDASCESESIKKAYSILSYAKKDNSAISGALFMESSPDILIEKGAVFDSMCRPIFHGWNLNNATGVVRSETFIQQPNYGGWWFFAFPVDKVKSMAFPFFVRGDDILFGMMNDFNIITTNGIACYAEDFSTKVSASTWYLDTRNHLMNMIFFKKSKKALIKTYCKFYLSCLLSHQYGSVASIRLALKHVVGNTDFWRDNADLKSVRLEISALSKNERMEKIEIPKKNIIFKNNEESKARRLIRILTINGIILPLINDFIYQDKTSRASLRQIFRHKKIFYYNRYSSSGYVATVSRFSVFMGLINLSMDCLKLLTLGNKKYERISKIVNELTTEKFWRQELKNKK